MPIFVVRTDNGERQWYADDEDHAREQHEDAFGVEEGEGILDIIDTRLKMSKHQIELKVVVMMEEMDGSIEESAELAMDLLAEAAKYWRDDLDISVTDYNEVEN